MTSKISSFLTISQSVHCIQYPYSPRKLVQYRYLVALQRDQMHMESNLGRRTSDWEFNFNFDLPLSIPPTIFCPSCFWAGRKSKKQVWNQAKSFSYIRGWHIGHIHLFYSQQCIIFTVRCNNRLQFFSNIKLRSVVCISSLYIDNMNKNYL